jgi:hypothetical protein
MATHERMGNFVRTMKVFMIAHQQNQCTPLRNQLQIHHTNSGDSCHFLACAHIPNGGYKHCPASVDREGKVHATQQYCMSSGILLLTNPVRL